MYLDVKIVHCRVGYKDADKLREQGQSNACQSG